MSHLMKHGSRYGIKCNFVQDPTHLICKLRNRKLKQTVALPIGSKQISSGHLKILLRDVPKRIHGLTRFDICPDDRQNFSSIKKCMNIRVRKAIKQFVPESEGTAFYLLLCEELASSFMSKDMIPLERVEKCFHAIYFIRIWRKWILASGYKLKTHFISRNAYVCGEINAANLLSLIKQLRNEPEKFLLPIFDSQACECAFRQFRSMGTVNYTRINFSLLELLNMTRRIECQNEILYNKLSSSEIDFPKLKAKSVSEKTKIYPLPTDEEIEDCLARAKRQAIGDAAKFEMNIDLDDIEEWQLPNTNVNVNDILHDDEFSGNEFSDEESNYDELDDEYQPYADVDSTNFADDLLNDDDESMEETDRKWVTVIENGEKKIIKKGTLVWLLTESREKLSKDRLTRVQESSKNINPAFTRNSYDFVQQKVIQSKRVNLCDWCVFKITHDEVNTDICFGVLLSFRYSQGKTEKDRRYKYDIVDLEDKPYLSEQVEALATWYFMSDIGRLIPTKVENHYYLSLKNYVATVKMPLIDADTDQLYYDEGEFQEIDKAILSLI